MPQLSRIVEALQEIAPLAYAEDWDNVGLLVGDLEQSISRGLLTIDYTPAVRDEAERERIDLIIAYHPPIFSGLKRVTSPSLIYDAIRRGVAIYSPHTALDAAAGGTNDMLADVLGLIDRRPLRLVQPKANQLKLVTFVPEKDLERVSQALFDAGAGRIGNYSRCSFRSPGIGTFFGDQNTSPSIGQSGRLEQVQEIRLETVVPVSRVAEVVAALKRAHSYEEPAFDLQQLAAAPSGIGQGRIGSVASIPREEIFNRIRKELRVEHLLISGPTTGAVRKAACCAGTGGEFLDDALAAGCDLYLSGEIRHHDALKAAHAGMTVVCTLHSRSERAALPRLAQMLNDKIPEFPLLISQTDRDPFAIA